MENCKSKGDCPNQVHSGQMVLGTVRLEAGLLRGSGQKILKAELAQGGPSGLSPFRLDGLVKGQAGGLTP